MTDIQFQAGPGVECRFKIHEGHGFEKVVYAGSETGVTGCLHRHCAGLEADLLCNCHPRLQILPISAGQYHAVLQQVIGKKAA